MSGYIVVKLRPRPPYAVTPHLDAFTLPGRPTPCLPRGHCYRRIAGGVVYEACISGEPWKPLIEARVYRGTPLEAKEAVAHIYNTGLDYARFLDCLREAGSRALLGLAERHLGLRPALNPTLFESLVKAIVGQQIPQRMALAITARLVEAYGPKTAIGGLEYYGFPEPAVLARAGLEELRGLGLSRRKAEYIVGLARLVEDGYPLEELRGEEPREAVEELQRIRGVGPWTAKLAYMAATGRLSLDLVEDRAVAGGLAGLGGGELEGVAEACGEYLGLVMYLAALAYEEARRRGASR